MGLSSVDRYDRVGLSDGQRTLIEWAGAGASVLELGASTGYMSEAMRGFVSRVVAVEYDPAAVALLRDRADEAYQGDLEDPSSLGALENRSFDVVILADVLEHLFDPQSVLERCQGYLGEAGRVLVSMPNVAFWRVRLELLRGRWETTQSGIMDETHIRWFTRTTAERMFANAGFTVLRREPVWFDMPLDARLAARVPRLNPLKQRINRRARAMSPEAFAGQFLWELAITP